MSAASPQSRVAVRVNQGRDGMSPVVASMYCSPQPLPADDQRSTLTMPALCGALGQYGELPLWLDEYQPGTAPWVAYAGFHAACEVFDVPFDIKAYWTWLVEHCKRSAADVKEHTILDLFWRELLSAVDAGVFGRKPSETRNG